MDSLAVTDHGNLHAAWSFYEQAKTQGIRPILGFDAYLAFGSRREPQKPAWAPSHYSHLVLLAKNRAGYKNLVRLSSIGFTEGFYRRPRIDREVLEAHREGIVCLAACLSGEVALGSGRAATRTPSGRRVVRPPVRPGRVLARDPQHGIPDERVVVEGFFASAGSWG
jgi:DNA polymerase III alpha subunit